VDLFNTPLLLSGVVIGSVGMGPLI